MKRYLVVKSRPVRRRLRAASQRIRLISGGGRLHAADYDEIYRSSEEYRADFRDSVYFPVWSRVCALIPRSASVLDIGCGPGQFAEMLNDRGIASYLGLDISEEAIRMARDRLPQFEVAASDALCDPMVAQSKADVIVCMEVLEHIDEDLALIERFPSGRQVVLTVPNFPSPGHVRWFSTPSDVAKRYVGALETCNVDAVTIDASGPSIIYIIKGRTRSG